MYSTKLPSLRHSWSADDRTTGATCMPGARSRFRFSSLLFPYLAHACPPYSRRTPATGCKPVALASPASRFVALALLSLRSHCHSWERANVGAP